MVGLRNIILNFPSYHKDDQRIYKERRQPMGNLKTVLFLCVLCSFVAVATVSCEKGPAEKAGQKLDEVVDSAKKAVDK